MCVYWVLNHWLASCCPQLVWLWFLALAYILEHSWAHCFMYISPLDLHTRSQLILERGAPRDPSCRSLPFRWDIIDFYSLLTSSWQWLKLHWIIRLEKKKLSVEIWEQNSHLLKKKYSAYFSQSPSYRHVWPSLFKYNPANPRASYLCPLLSHLDIKPVIVDCSGWIIWKWDFSLVEYFHSRVTGLFNFVLL